MALDWQSRSRRFNLWLFYCHAVTLGKSITPVPQFTKQYKLLSAKDSDAGKVTTGLGDSTAVLGL